MEDIRGQYGNVLSQEQVRKYLGKGRIVLRGVRWMSFSSARHKCGLTQAQVGEKFNLHQSTVHLWEIGKTRPRAALLPKIAKLYGCTVDELLAEDGLCAEDAAVFHPTGKRMEQSGERDTNTGDAERPRDFPAAVPGGCEPSTGRERRCDMPREKETFRDNLASLRAAFPGKETISIPEASKYLGLDRDRLLRDETFPHRKCGGQYIVVLVNLARWLAV